MISCLKFSSFFYFFVFHFDVLCISRIFSTVLLFFLSIFIFDFFFPIFSILFLFWYKFEKFFFIFIFSFLNLDIVFGILMIKIFRHIFQVWNFFHFVFFVFYFALFVLCENFFHRLWIIFSNFNFYFVFEHSCCNIFRYLIFFHNFCVWNFCRFCHFAFFYFFLWLFRQWDNFFHGLRIFSILIFKHLLFFSVMLRLLTKFFGNYFIIFGLGNFFLMVITYYNYKFSIIFFVFEILTYFLFFILSCSY